MCFILVGKSIGKLVFLQKTHVDEARLATIDSQLRNFEVKFYKSLYDEMNPPQHAYIARYASSTPLVGHTYMPPMTTQQMMMPGGMLTQPMQQQPVIMPPQTVISQTAVSTQPIVVPSAVHTKNLQQTYLNALNQMMKNNAQPAAAAVAPQTTAGAVTNNNGNAATMAPPPQQASAVPVAAPTVANPKIAQVAPAANAAASTITHQKPPQQPAPPPGAKSTSSSEVPDFLSTFEKVSGEEQRPPWMMPGAPLLGGFEGTGVPLQCSPPLTSKSFDDLHQMLGSDLSPRPFDLNASKCEEQQQEGQANGSAATNTAAASQQRSATPTHQADIYAAFAQQSALAVSQHSAYCRADKPSTAAPVAQPETPDISTSLAAMYGCQPLASTTTTTTYTTTVVNLANLRAHATQQRKLQDQTTGTASKLKSAATTTTFPSSTARLVSGSERSSDVGSTEDVSSMHGSTSSNNDTTSNDSDSVSDEGPPRKKTRMGEEHANGNAGEVISPVSSDRSSPRE